MKQIKQKGGKEVPALEVEGNVNPGKIVHNSFNMEKPLKFGKE